MQLPNSIKNFNVDQESHAFNDINITNATDPLLILYNKEEIENPQTTPSTYNDATANKENLDHEKKSVEKETEKFSRVSVDSISIFDL